MKAFKSLMEIIPQDGVLIYNGEDENIKNLLPLYSGTKISYGFEQGDWTAHNISFV